MRVLLTCLIVFPLHMAVAQDDPTDFGTRPWYESQQDRIETDPYLSARRAHLDDDEREFRVDRQRHDQERHDTRRSNDQRPDPARTSPAPR